MNMKHILFITILIAGTAGAETLMGWDVYGRPQTTQQSITGAVLSASVSSPAAVLTAGAGLTLNNTSNNWLMGSWTMPDASTYSDSVVSNDYITFSITAGSQALTVTNISMRLRNNNANSPDKFQISCAASAFGGGALPSGAADFGSTWSTTWSSSPTIQTNIQSGSVTIGANQTMYFAVFGYSAVATIIAGLAGGDAAAPAANAGLNGSDYDFVVYGGIVGTASAHQGSVVIIK